MPHVQGQIEKVYHNYKDKQDNPLPDNKINHKIKMNGDLYVIKGKFCPDFVKEGKRVSIAYNVWTQPSTGFTHNYVMADKATNRLLINDLNPQDDDLPDDNLDNNGNAFQAPTHDERVDFNPNKLEAQGETRQVLKEQQIFVTALLKSSIEGNCLNPFEEDKLNKAILTFKEVYNTNFR